MSHAGTHKHPGMISFSEKKARDAVGGILLDSAEINFTYDDGVPSITAVLIDDSVVAARTHFTATARLLGRSTAAAGAGEEIALGAGLSLVGGVLDVVPGGGSYTDEQAQDAVAGALVDSASIDFSYNDGVPSITAVVLPAGVDHNQLNNLAVGDVHTQYHNDARALTWLGTRSTSDVPEGSNQYFTNERAQDAVGTIMTNSAEVAFTYNDAGNTISASLITNSIVVGRLTMATARLVGRTTAAAGAGEEISVGTGLSLAGGVLSNTVSAPTGANPSATVGLAAVNGAAGTFMRSDAAPALSVAIVPTWSGTHTFGHATSIVTTGNVGVGVTPSWRLHARVSTDRNFAIRSGADLTGGLSDGINVLSVNDAANANRNMSFSGSAFMFSGGNVGIGMVPGVILDVTGTTVRFSQNLLLTGGDANHYIYTQGTEHLRIRSGGSGGIYFAPDTQTGPVDFFAGRLTIVATGVTTWTGAISATVINISNTISTSSGHISGMAVSPNYTGSGESAHALFISPTFQPSANVVESTALAIWPAFAPPSGVTITNAYMVQARIGTGSSISGNAISNIYGWSVVVAYGTLKPTNAFGISVPNMGSSGITSAIGLLIDAQTGATTNIGLRNHGSTAFPTSAAQTVWNGTTEVAVQPNATHVTITATADRTMTDVGIAAGVDGQLLIVFNASAFIISFPDVTVDGNSLINVGSGTTFQIQSNGTAIFYFQGGLGRWVPIPNRVGAVV